MSVDPPDSSGRRQTAGSGARFSELFDRFWDSTVPLQETATEVAFIEHRLDLAIGARLICVPSGCSRQALALARRGHLVLGIDRCQDAVERGLMLAGQAGVAASFRHSPDLLLPEDASYDGAICMRHHLSGPELGQLVSRLSLCLKPGGRALIDLATAAAGGERTMQTITGAGFRVIDMLTDLQGTKPVTPAAPQLLLCERG